ncbi:hypothetical protein NFI96_008801, partial [Prochilodus magdalenae]
MGCTLENREQQLQHEQPLPITAHTGGSVLLPCSCTDLQTKPKEFSWKKDIRNTERRKEISRESAQYKNRVQLFNDHSPGNLSLLISHLTEEDKGDYECSVKVTHINIRLTVKESLPFVPFALVTVIFLHIVVGVVYCTKRTKDPRVHYSTGDGDDAVINLFTETVSSFFIENLLVLYGVDSGIYLNKAAKAFRGNQANTFSSTANSRQLFYINNPVPVASDRSRQFCIGTTYTYSYTYNTNINTYNQSFNNNTKNNTNNYTTTTCYNIH